jgi:hypothetical protein
LEAKWSQIIIKAGNAAAEKTLPSSDANKHLIIDVAARSDLAGGIKRQIRKIKIPSTNTTSPSPMPTAKAGRIFCVSQRTPRNAGYLAIFAGMVASERHDKHVQTRELSNAVALGA